MQSYFFPYLGYFQLIHSVDKFIILDDVNYPKGGWVNRNRVIANGKPTWITLPIAEPSPNVLIKNLKRRETPNVIKKQLRLLNQNYRKQSGFREAFPLIETLISEESSNLSEYLTRTIKHTCNYLEIKTDLIESPIINHNNDLTGIDRIIAICQELKAKQYINLPGGRSLYQHQKFQEHGINLKFIRPNLPHYNQPSDVFLPSLSILDTILCNERSEASKMARDFVIED